MNELTAFRAGWVMTGLYALFMLIASAAPKLSGSALATAPLEVVGWPAELALPIGLIEVACTLLFVLPRTGLLGAALSTALLGGAVAANLRVGQPPFGHTLFGVYLGLFLWIALWLRDPLLRQVFPLRRA